MRITDLRSLQEFWPLLGEGKDSRGRQGSGGRKQPGKGASLPQRLIGSLLNSPTGPVLRNEQGWERLAARTLKESEVFTAREPQPWTTGGRVPGQGRS